MLLVSTKIFPLFFFITRISIFKLSTELYFGNVIANIPLICKHFLSFMASLKISNVLSNIILMFLKNNGVT